MYQIICPQILFICECIESYHHINNHSERKGIYLVILEQIFQMKTIQQWLINQHILRCRINNNVIGEYMQRTSNIYAKKYKL